MLNAFSCVVLRLATFDNANSTLEKLTYKAAVQAGRPSGPLDTGDPEDAFLQRFILTQVGPLLSYNI